MKNNIKAYLLIVIYFIWVLVIAKPYDSVDYYVYGIFLFNAGLTSYNLFRDPYPYSLNKFFWAFTFVFFVFAPTIQFATNSYPWDKDFTDYDVLIANTLIMSCLVVYSITYGYFKRKSDAKPAYVKPQSFWNINYSPTRYYLGVFLLIVAVAMIIAKLGFASLWLRVNAEEAVQDNNIADNLLFDKLSRSIILYVALTTILFYKSMKEIRSRWLLIMIMCLAVMSNFPLSLPRNFAATFYFAILFSFVRDFKNKDLVTFLLLSMLLLVFPIMTYARLSVFNAQYVVDNFKDILSNAFVRGDFDAFSMVCRAVRYLDLHQLATGHQMSGAMFYFIPRSMWPDKPIGSGAMIADTYKWTFTNVSCPFLAEGFLNFSWLGAIGFYFLLALTAAKYDGFYWKMLRSANLGNYWIVMYPACLGLLVFILRGDMMSSYAYTSSLILISIGLHFVVTKVEKRKQFVLVYS